MFLDSGTWCRYPHARCYSWHLVPLILEVRMPEQTAAQAAEAEALTSDELLVEEVSIDGMCGVY